MIKTEQTGYVEKIRKLKAITEEAMDGVIQLFDSKEEYKKHITAMQKHAKELNKIGTYKKLPLRKVKITVSIEEVDG